MVFSELVKLRDELSNISYNNNRYATIASYDEDFTPDVTSGSLQIYDTAVNYDGSSLHIYPEEGGQQVLNKCDIANNLDTVVSGTSYRVGDIFQNVSNTGDTYAALALITQKFSYTNRISLTNVNDIITRSSNQTSLDYDSQELMNQLLAVTDKDGYISSKSWLIALKGWMDSCKTGADNRSPELDNTAPNTLASIYNIVIPAIQSALSLIFSAMATIFGAVGVIIGTAIAKLFELVNQAISESGSINADCCNTFAKGVAISRQESLSGATSAMEPYTRNDYSINYVDLPSCGLFFWQGDSSNKIKLNAYLCPNVSPSKIAAAITAGDRGIVWTSGYRGVEKLAENIDFATKLTDEEQALVSTDIAFYSLALICSEFARWCFSTPRAYYYSDSKINQRIRFTVPTPGSSVAFPSDPFIRAVAVAAVCLHSYYLNGNYFSVISKTQVIDSANLLVSKAFDRRDNFTDLYETKYNGSDTNFSDCRFFIYGNPLVTCSYIDDRIDRAGAWFHVAYNDSESKIDVSDYGFSVGLDVLVPNSLPTEFMAEFSSLSSETLTKIMVISSLVAISAAVVSLRVSKAMRLKKIRKQVLRTQKIEDAKAVYDDYRDPDREGGPKTPKEINEALTNYTKEVDKFNRLGKIFHWGSYDAANSWIDTDTGGSSEPTTMSGIIDMFQNAREKSDTDLLSIKGSGSTKVNLNTVVNKLDEILGLIK